MNDSGSADSYPALPPASFPFAHYGPLTFGQILDRIAQILSRNWRLFLSLGSVPAGASLLIYAIVFGVMYKAGAFPATQHSPIPTHVLWQIFPVMAVCSILMMIVYVLFEAAAAQAALAANRGVTISFREAYATAWQHLGRFLGLIVMRTLWVMLPMMAIWIVAAVAFGIAAALGRGSFHPGAIFLLMPVVVLGYLGSLVYGVWMMMRLLLAVPASIAENLTVMAALKRSAALAHKAKGRMFLVLLVMYAIGYAIFLVVEAIALAVAGIALIVGRGMHIHWPHPIAVAAAVIFGLCAVVAFFLWIAAFWSAYAITFTVFYDDQRVRIDGPAPLLSDATIV